MALPTTATIATRTKVPANDARLPGALAVALSWARTTLGRPIDDTLADLNESGNDAVAGMAADIVRVPSVQAALIEGTLDISMVPFDIGRRWELPLCRGNKHLWAIA